MESVIFAMTPHLPSMAFPKLNPSFTTAFTELDGAWRWPGLSFPVSMAMEVNRNFQVKKLSAA
jgi:hypothetical protein